ncbi:exported hypothetical protein [Sphingobacterium sp. PM2-P1-29]|nr:exported hypothetical protein [Sphingobacterium sp. PM2-P1-29]
MQGIKKTILNLRILLIAITTLTVHVAVGQSEMVNTKRLQLATYRYAENSRVENLLPLADILEKELGREINVLSYPSIEELIGAIKENKADIALISTMGYLLLNEQKKDSIMEPVLTLTVPEDSKGNYRTAFVVADESRFNSLEDIRPLKDITMTLVRASSTSGNLIPRAVYAERGIPHLESEFKEVNYSGSHKASVDSLLSGSTDLVAIGSTEYFLNAENPKNKNRIKLVHMSEPIPLGPLLLNKELENNLKEDIKRVLLSLHEKGPDAFSSLKSGWAEAEHAERFLQIDRSYYEKFLSIYNLKDFIMK